MDKTLISVDIPNVISVGIILFVVLVLYALAATYIMKWAGLRPVGNSGSF